jgi:hypothetical protein
MAQEGLENGNFVCFRNHKSHLESFTFNKNRYHLIIYRAMCGILRLWTQPQLLSKCDDSIFLSHESHPSQALLLCCCFHWCLLHTLLRWLNIDRIWLIPKKVLKSRRTLRRNQRGSYESHMREVVRRFYAFLANQKVLSLKINSKPIKGQSWTSCLCVSSLGRSVLIMHNRFRLFGL